MAAIETNTRLKEPDINQGIIKSVYTHKCFCCSSQTQLLILLSTCNHADFLDNIVKNKSYLNDAHICIFCHRMLIKIELFKRQVEKNILLLEDRVPFIKTKKITNLYITPPVTTNSTEPLDFKFEIKTEIEIQHQPDIPHQTEIKLERDHNFLEIEIPPIVEKEETFIKNYEGKIRVFNLTPEELRAERKEMAKKDKYLRLPYKCETCIVSFDQNNSWKKHMETRHTKTEKCFQCDVCMSVFTREMFFNKHVNGHYRRVQCLECGIKYDCDQTAIVHYNEQHISEDSEMRKEYTCKECEFKTTISQVYKSHLEKHGPTNIFCNICGETFINADGYRTHMYTVHNLSARVYRCQPCNITYSAKSDLLTHLRTRHDNVPDTYCAPCNINYRTRKALMTHLRHHSRHVSDSRKRFICDVCGAKYVKKVDIRNHILWDHMKIKPHKCDKCEKSFRKPVDLRRHFAYVHNKIRPPKDKICHHCGKGFYAKATLESHIRIHTGERPYVCRHCNATFAHSAAHYTHIKLKHGGVK